MNKEENITIKVKRKEPRKKDGTITVSGEVYSIIQEYSENTGIPIKMFADTLLKYALDHVEIIYD